MKEKVLGEDVAILAELSTGLAIKHSKPRRIPHRYIDGPIKEVLNYLLRTIEKEGTPEETMLAANIQDHMSSRQYIIKVNGNNVSQNDNFGKIVEEFTSVEDVGSEGDSMKYREVSIIVTRVEEGGNDKRILKKLVEDEVGYIKKYFEKTKGNENFFSNWQYILLDFLLVLSGIVTILLAVGYFDLPIFLNAIAVGFGIWFPESEYSFYNRKTGISDLKKARRSCEESLKMLRQIEIRNTEKA